jgi:outer membrane protein assembly factor BamD (BamD/ComL family)
MGGIELTLKANVTKSWLAGAPALLFLAASMLFAAEEVESARNEAARLYATAKQLIEKGYYEEAIVKLEPMMLWQAA